MTSKYRLIWRLMEGQRLRYGMAIGALVLGSVHPLPGAAGAPGGAGRHSRGGPDEGLAVRRAR